MRVLDVWLLHCFIIQRHRSRRRLETFSAFCLVRSAAAAAVRRSPWQQDHRSRERAERLAERAANARRLRLGRATARACDLLFRLPARNEAAMAMALPARPIVRFAGLCMRASTSVVPAVRTSAQPWRDCGYSWRRSGANAGRQNRRPRQRGRLVGEGMIIDWWEVGAQHHSEMAHYPVSILSTLCWRQLNARTSAKR